MSAGAGSSEPLAATQQWLERAVIGLNLCPFAKGVHARGLVRWVESAAAEPQPLLADLLHELQLLASADPGTVDTTLLVHPRALRDFADYNAFLDVADAAIDGLGLNGVLQIASFHPQYRFAGTRADDITNCTNRSPFPMLQLLREDSVARAMAAFPDAAGIYERNIRTLRGIGRSGWKQLWAAPPA